MVREKGKSRFGNRITVMLSNEILKDLDKIAAVTDDYRGRLIRVYVKEGIAKYKKANKIMDGYVKKLKKEKSLNNN
ncbi:MAG: hypothetical protein ABFC94_06695 [Syntrophomonas sp.]